MYITKLIQLYYSNNSIDEKRMFYAKVIIFLSKLLLHVHVSLNVIYTRIRW